METQKKKKKSNKDLNKLGKNHKQSWKKKSKPIRKKNPIEKYNKS